jgi:hypothetical protein
MVLPITTLSGNSIFTKAIVHFFMENACYMLIAALTCSSEVSSVLALSCSLPTL